LFGWVFSPRFWQNLPLEQVETTCWNYNTAVCRGDIGIEEYNSLLAKAFNVESFDWAHYYLSSIDPIAESRELLAWASENYKVGLLSNIMPGLIMQLMERDLIPTIDYDVIIDSSQARHIKPEAEIFKIAASEAKVSPEEILLIDDSRANLMSAAEQGWRTAWFDDFRPQESCDNVRQILEF
jgi:FMN phosphatase YigB (HAD superfamily)